MASNLIDPALADLREIVRDYGSPVAAEASLLAADVLERLAGIDDAMAVVRRVR